jgi:hypothetical protein
MTPTKTNCHRITPRPSIIHLRMFSIINVRGFKSRMSLSLMLRPSIEYRIGEAKNSSLMKNSDASLTSR